MLSPAASTAVPITAPNQHNKFPTKNLLKTLLANPSYPSGLPREEQDGKTHGKASRTRDLLPFPCDSTTNTPFPDATYVVTPPPAPLLFTRTPAAPQPNRDSRECCWKSHSFTCGLSITAKATTSPGNELGQLSTTLLLQLC